MSNEPTEVYTPDGMEGPGRYDAGDGVTYSPYYTDETMTELVGLWIWHPCPNTFARLGFTDMTGVGPNSKTGTAWGYTNTDDPAHITLEGSVLDPDCGWHGYIRDGKWESC